MDLVHPGKRLSGSGVVSQVPLRRVRLLMRFRSENDPPWAHVRGDVAQQDIETLSSLGLANVPEHCSQAP